MHTIQKSILGLAAALCFAGAQADTLAAYSSTPATATNNSYVDTFSAGAGAGNVSFQIQGYNTLDGDNDYIDIFHFYVNGAELFSGTWDLGGGGADRVLLDLNGASVSHVGQTVDISVATSFLQGSNTVTFSYESPTSFEGSPRAGFQGLGDEGWGLNAATVTGNAVVAVPEPETYALMLAGLGALGFVARRRKAAR
ncbi:MAG: PEP-CTERM sorting domain-containing protein [Bacteriovorax sp.]|nr:PEP-CTERM sorting domain-containing protein [Rhizobacter sp.]